MTDRNILILEHDSIQKEYLSTLLLKEGYHTYQATSQSQSLELLEKGKIDFVIVSNSLPNTNIVELCKAIKSTTFTSDIAIILSFDTKESAKASFPVLESLVEGYLLPSHQDWEVLSKLASVERLKAAERKLRDTGVQLVAQAEYYTSLFDNHPDAIYAFDLEGNFTYVNGVAITMSGYSREELLEMSFHSFLTADELAPTVAYFDKAKTGENLFFTSTLVTKSFNRLELSHTLSPILEGEKIIGVYGVSKDITVAVRLEKIASIEHRLREQALGGASLEENLLFLLRGFEGISRGMICLFLCVDKKRNTFTYPLAPSLPQTYTSYFHGLTIEGAISPFGKVVESKESLYLPHLDVEGQWDAFKESTLTGGLKSLFCSPVFSSTGEVKAYTK